MAAVRAALDGAAIDAIATDGGRPPQALLVADMDSTIVTGETLDELADFAGLKERIAAITARAMNGELDFKAALRERVAMLRGLPVDALERTWERVRLTPGARELVATMRAHGAYAALVSGGFSFFTSRVAALCGFDLHRSNTLLDDGATLTGRVAEPILDRDTKLATLTGLAAAQCAADVGDAGGGRRRQRPGHAARRRAGRRVPCQADRRGGGAGAGGSWRPARAAVRAGLSRRGVRRRRRWHLTLWLIDYLFRSCLCQGDRVSPATRAAPAWPLVPEAKKCLTKLMEGQPKRHKAFVASPVAAKRAGYKA